MGWTDLVLIAKRNTKTRGIGLLNTPWKLVEALIYTSLSTRLQMHIMSSGPKEGRGRL